MRTNLSLTFALTIAVVSVACGGSPAPAGSASKAATAMAQVLVKVTEYGYEGLPAQLEAGLVEITLQNGGKQDHELILARLTEGNYETFKSDLAKGIAAVAPRFDGVGSPDRVSPGDRLRAVVNLVDGDYVAYSSVVVEGGPEVVTRSMHQGLRVVLRTSPAMPEPRPDVVLELKDGVPQLSGALRAGPQILKVTNAGGAGPRVASATIVRLEPGKTVNDFTTWLTDRQGPRPFTRAGGVVSLSPGRYGWALLDLAPGDYVIYNLATAQLTMFTVK